MKIIESFARISRRKAAQAAERIVRRRRKRFSPLNGKPHVEGVVDKVLTKNPRKPNSAIRKVVDANLKSVGKRNIKKVTVYITGENADVKKGSSILIQGGGAKDISVRLEWVKNWKGGVR